MKRFTTLIATLALAVAACTGSGSQAATQAPDTPVPTATPATVTPTPEATRVTVSSAVTWDGQTCTYEGPAAVPFMATVKFTMTNSKDGDFTTLYVGPVQEGTTWEQVSEWAASPEDHDASFLIEQMHVLTPGEAETSPLTAVMTRDLQYLVLCARDPMGSDPGVMAPAVLVDVLKG